MSKTEMRVEDVIEYYGKWIDTEDRARYVMRKVREMTKGFSKLSFSAKMNLVRDYLKYVEKHSDIPFNVGYRRKK